MLITNSDSSAAIIMAFLLCALVFMAATNPNANIAFNIDLGTTTYVEYKDHHGRPETRFNDVYFGRPCVVYVYNTPYGYYQYVYVVNGVVYNIERRY